MILDVKPIRTPALRMREDIYASLLNYIGKDYMLMLSMKWGFRINSENKNRDKIAEYINLEEDSLDYCLKKYNGITTIYKEKNGYFEFLKEAKNNIECKLPILLNVSTIGLPYHRTYKNKEEAHLHEIMFIGYDEKYAYLLDPPWTYDVIKLSLEEVYEILEHFEIFRIDEECSNINLKFILETLINKVNKRDSIGDMFNSIEYFADLIEEKFDIKIETDQKSFDMESLRFNPLISGIDYIGRLRLTMVDVFKYIADHYDLEVFLSIADMFQNAAQSWIRLRYVLIKGCCKNQDNYLLAKNKVAEKIRELAIYERKIRDSLEMILEKINKGNCNKKTNEDNDVTNFNTDIQILNLESLFNNCAFHNSNNKLKANLNIKAVEYYISDAIEYSQYMNIGKMRFKIPDINSERFDNIFCDGQNIFVEPYYYTGIMVMGFSVYKGYAGTLKIEYDNGSQNELNFALTNSGSFKTLFGEEIAFSTDLMSKGKISKGNVYCKEYKINSENKVTKIILPEWELCSIIAISLRKKLV